MEQATVTPPSGAVRSSATLNIPTAFKITPLSVQLPHCLATRLSASDSLRPWRLYKFTYLLKIPFKNSCTRIVTRITKKRYNRFLQHVHILQTISSKFVDNFSSYPADRRTHKGKNTTTDRVESKAIIIGSHLTKIWIARFLHLFSNK